MKLVVNLPKPSVDCYQNALGYELGFFMDLIFTENVIKTVFKNNVVGKHELRRTKFKTEEFLLLFYNIIVLEL